MFTRPSDRRRKLLLQGGTPLAEETVCDFIEGGGPSGRPTDEKDSPGRTPSRPPERVAAPEPTGPFASPPVDPFSLMTPTDSAGIVAVELTSENGETESLRLDAPLVLVGRAAGCDLRLTGPDVAGRHAALVAAGDRYLALDLGAATGLFADGRAVPFAWFGPGDELGIGPFRLRRPDSARTRPPTPVDALFSRHETPPVRLALRSDRPGKPPRDAVIDRPVTLVGRSSACKIRLADPDASDVHAGLFLSPRGLFVLDLLGRQGLVVNGRGVKSARLEVGDQIRIGSRWLGVVEASRPSGPSTAPSEETSTDANRVDAVSTSAVAELLRAENGRAADFLRDVIAVLLPDAEFATTSELERYIELSARITALRSQRLRPAADDARSGMTLESLEAERDHCRRTVLSLLAEVTGGPVGF